MLDVVNIKYPALRIKFFCALLFCCNALGHSTAMLLLWLAIAASSGRLYFRLRCSVFSSLRLAVEGFGGFASRSAYFWVQTHGAHHARYFQVLHFYESFGNYHRASTPPTPWSAAVCSGIILWPAFVDESEPHDWIIIKQLLDNSSRHQANYHDSSLVML